MIIFDEEYFNYLKLNINKTIDFICNIIMICNDLNNSIKYI